MDSLNCFKAYDIRGKIHDQLTPKFAYHLGRAYASEFKPNQLVVGYDIRLSSIELHDALVKGLMDSGVDVISLGLCGTEEVSYQVSALDTDGGIMITASHNPIEYNGMKLSLKGSVPLGIFNGLQNLKSRIEHQNYQPLNSIGQLIKFDDKSDYIQHLLSYIDLEKLQPLRIVVNSGNGCAAPILDLLAPHLPFEFIKINHEPDGTFPNGIPNPLLLANRTVTSQAVLKHNADLGIAWDGDCDRCFFFDHHGNFVDSYYVIGLLAEQMIEHEKQARIVSDTRLIWNTENVVNVKGGTLMLSKGGHSYMKQAMREYNAIYGGEVSGHHYFRDFAFCDSGMIPWLIMTELLSISQQTLYEHIKESQNQFICSDEMNFNVDNHLGIICAVEKYFGNEQSEIINFDGLTMNFSQWRFNLRASNTESLLRLNIETKGDKCLLQEKQQLLQDLIQTYNIQLQ